MNWPTRHDNGQPEKRVIAMQDTAPMITNKMLEYRVQGALRFETFVAKSLSEEQVKASGLLYFEVIL